MVTVPPLQDRYPRVNKPSEEWNLACVDRDDVKRSIQGDGERTPYILEALLACSQNAIVVYTPSGEVLTWNAGAEAPFGYRAEEMAGRKISCLISRDKLGAEEEFVEQVLNSREVCRPEDVALPRSISPLPNSPCGNGRPCMEKRVSGGRTANGAGSASESLAMKPMRSTMERRR